MESYSSQLIRGNVRKYMTSNVKNESFEVLLETHPVFIDYIIQKIGTLRWWTSMEMGVEMESDLFVNTFFN